MDFRVIDYLNAMDKNLGGNNDIHIVSGFRSRAYNDLLLREGHGVVPHSLHLAGKAIDFRIPGVGLNTMRRIALGLSAGGACFSDSTGRGTSIGSFSCSTLPSSTS